jgi:voltage-dependent calcium channel alpha-2/delta-4
MTGLRREISKHVVSTILDTLTENDYVNVYNFSEETGPVVECFKGQLVQVMSFSFHFNYKYTKKTK